jgi:hypothetical protein
MFGLGMYAAVSDADGAGYLGLQGSTGAQQLRNEFGAWCAGLAAEYLHRNCDRDAAKRAIRADFAVLATETDTGCFTVEEKVLIDSFASQVDAAIERLAGKSAKRITFELWAFRTPRLVKILAAVAIVSSVAILFFRIFAA